MTRDEYIVQLLLKNGRQWVPWVWRVPQDGRQWVPRVWRVLQAL
jgi:hypothetical protein